MGMPGEWSHRPWRRNVGSRNYWNFLDISVMSRSVHVTSRPVGKTIKGPYSDHRAIECVDRLGSPLECERLWNLSLEFLPLCELVSC
ncbi:hypothetical protein AVEN_204356-1 [Araneus ventricosus]|uniref:Endonuclease/exonuclease/phosphatase domain-containing protein n=1 Tax=Araneus ventricosus TaxID=182803 RepID=A0A4Y2STX0_ARAVE|nr:hypothetical protein AVEN_204356-1 [Araneus ventricosus]